MSFSIRQATRADIPALNQLVQLSIRKLGGNYYDAQQVESSLKYLFGIDSRVVEDGTYYVVEVKGTIVACGGWSCRKTPFGGDQAGNLQDAGLRNPAVDAAVIRAFFVHPDWARQGIGRQLLDYSEAQALKEGFAWFELTATLSGYPLYIRYGYQDVEKIDIKLSDGTQLGGVRMEKRPMVSTHPETAAE